MKGTLNEFSVTSFVTSKEGRQLSSRRVLYHILDKLNNYDISSDELIQSISSPVSVALCPTSKCIRECKFCSNTERNKINRKLNAEYSREVINEIIKDLNIMKVMGVSIAGGGEPLTYNKDLFNSFLSKDNLYFRIGIHTNGVYLNNLFCEDVLRSGNISYINISAVAHNDELYKKVACGFEGQFLLIEENIKKALSLKMKYNCFPTFGVKILLCRENYKYTKDIYNYFSKLGVPNILLRCVGNFEESQDVELSFEQMNELQEIMSNELKMSSNQIEAVKGKSLIKPPVPSRCWINALQYTAGIDPDGEVYLCSPWSRKEYSVGNVNNENLLEIWGSDRHKEVVKKLNFKLKNGECNPLLCRHYYSNLAIDAFINGLLKPLPKEEMEYNYGRFI